uniref:Uncharacterized protein n=1 Tax=Lepeophtheirus salmonis TaxID=72036 RepID=A0A0K2TI69_LEPSM
MAHVFKTQCKLIRLYPLQYILESKISLIQNLKYKIIVIHPGFF